MLIGPIAIAGLALQAPDLLGQARLVAEPSRWYARQSGVPYYEWLGRDSLFFLTLDWGARDFTWNVFDLKVGQSRRLDAMTKLGREYRAGKEITPSPDGRTFLWSGWRNYEDTWHLSTVDGRMIASWPRHAANRVASAVGPETIAYWSRDGQSIFEGEAHQSNYKFWIRPQRNLQKEVAFRLSMPTGVYWSRCFEADTGRMMVFEDPWSLANWRSTVIVSWPAKSPKLQRRRKVDFPEGYEIWARELSPDRQRIVWVCHTSADLKEPRIGLWVSSVDGANLRRLGEIVDSRGPAINQWQQFGEVKWVPGSKEISFCYLGKLYVVAAG